MQLDTISLPPGLRWSDKYGWTPVRQETTISLSGSLIIEEAAQLAGRPITLSGGERRCWCQRSLVDQLYATLQDAGRQMTLDLDADGSRTVVWRRDRSPLEVVPLIDYDQDGDSDLYAIIALRFMEV